MNCDLFPCKHCKKILECPTFGASIHNMISIMTTCLLPSTAKIDTYLLEKSRIVAQEKDERNFHVFYFMFAGLTQQQLENICLQPPESYRYS